MARTFTLLAPSAEAISPSTPTRSGTFTFRALARGISLRLWTLPPVPTALTGAPTAFLRVHGRPRDGVVARTTGGVRAGPNEDRASHSVPTGSLAAPSTLVGKSNPSSEHAC